MIENIQNIQNLPKEPLGTSGISTLEPIGQGKKEDSKEAYDISLSDEAWDSLENGKKERDASGKEKLSEDDQRKVDELKRIDRNVHIHEQAHVSAGGAYVRGGASYNYVTGPDGQRYANAGHVNIDVSPEKEPEATIRKADVVRRAALAPADPSPADREIAAQATKMAQEAQGEIAKKQGAQSSSDIPQGTESVASEQVSVSPL